MSSPQPHPNQAKRTALLCTALVAGMTGLAFAAAPLYDMFCKVTGFGGTPMVRTVTADRVLEREVSILFDANVSSKLGWRFEPESPEVKVRIGETKTIYYKITNQTARATTGIASYNVTPQISAAYFVKIQCFCFTDTTLKPGESVTVPVIFYVDPEIEKNRDLADVKSITLSYTYFPSKAGQPDDGAKVESTGSVSPGRDAGKANL